MLITLLLVYKKNSKKIIPDDALSRAAARHVVLPALYQSNPL